MQGWKGNIKKNKLTPLFFFFTAIFISCLIVSNIIAVKLINIFGLVLPAAIIIFPITYIFGDILTEVYGYKMARLVIWLGFFSNLIVVVFIKIAEVIPPAQFWDAQQAYSRILGYTPRILTASFIAYLVGEFLNSFVLSKMKIWTKGRFLWTRTIGSTLVGQLADSGVFITIAFIGKLPLLVLFKIIITQWLFKVSYEALVTPFTYLVVGFLKRKEKIDTFDLDTNFNPLRLFEI